MIGVSVAEARTGLCSTNVKALFVEDMLILDGK
jgi:hypothetical protein